MLGNAVMPGVGGLIGAGVSGILGNIFSSGAKKEVQRLAEEAYQYAMSIGAPPDMTKAIMLEAFKQNGMYVPELEQAIDLAVSEVGAIQEDPSLREGQMSALQLMSDRATGGLTAEDKAAFNQLRNEVATQNRGEQQALLQEMQARGLGGSGAELASRLQAQQSAANRAAQGADDIAAAASRNALEAAARYGTMSGDVRNQDFAINKQMADARDLRNKMLYENSVALQARNINSKNAAQQTNLARQQSIADANTQMANAERTRQHNAAMDNWNAERDLAKLRAEAALGKAGVKSGQAQQTANMWSNIGTAAGGLFDKLDARGVFNSTATNIKNNNQDLLNLEDDVMKGRK